MQEESGSRVYTDTRRSAITAITNDALQTGLTITDRNWSYVIIKEKRYAVVALEVESRFQHNSKDNTQRIGVCLRYGGRGYEMRGCVYEKMHVTKRGGGVSKIRCACLRKKRVCLSEDGRV